MQYTPNFNFMVAEGTDTVNLLTQCYPNFTSLDTILQAIKESGTTTAVTTKVGTVHQIVRNVADCNVIRWVATANYAAGDTFTVDGVSVTATAMDGTALPAGAFVINQSVLAILNSGVLTIIGVPGVSSVDAEDVAYDNSGSGLTAADVQAAIDELAARPVVADAEDVTYDNSISGLTATDVQAAIDELKALIPASPAYTTSGLEIISGRCTINSGGYYVSGGTCYVDMTVTIASSISANVALVKGFPQASTPVPGTGTTPVTSAFNNAYIAQSSSNLTCMLTSAAVTSGQSIHYIGSFTIL